MIVWDELTNSEINDLDRNLPVVIPVGLVESHGPHLGVGFDVHSADYVSRKICEATGAILCPALPYGFADTNREYPGTLGVRADTLAAIVADLCAMLYSHGFKKVIFLSGHGGNQIGVQLGFQRAWEHCPNLKPVYWCYFTVAGINLSHADEGETSIALAMDAIVHMDRAQDFALNRPWYEVRSRWEIAPDSGGVNGKPSLATREKGQELLDRILPVLIDKLNAAISEEA
jgi:creatinine amidohydrolase